MPETNNEARAVPRPPWIQPTIASLPDSRESIESDALGIARTALELATMLGKTVSEQMELLHAMQRERDALDMPPWSALVVGGLPDDYSPARKGDPVAVRAMAEVVVADPPAPDNDEPRGLYGKYRITKSDGSPVAAEALHFVLRYDSDRHARHAMLTYAESVEGENPVLAEDIRRHLKGLHDADIEAQARAWRPEEIPEGEDLSVLPTGVEAGPDPGGQDDGC